MSQYPQYQAPNALNMLALGIGQPSPDFLVKPLKMLKDSILTVTNEPTVLQYGDKRGFLEFRQMIIKMLTKYTKCNVSPFRNFSKLTDKQVYMTNGISQALVMLSTLFTSQRPIIFAEDPTYFLALDIFRDLKYDVRSFSLSNLSEFDQLIGNETSDYEILVYIIPFNRNPTGETIKMHQLVDLVALCRKYPKLKILSDETYQILSFDSASHPVTIPLAMLHGSIISMGTFSKIFAPAVRLGWLISFDDKLFDRLDATGFIDSGGSVNPIMGEMMVRVMENFSDQFDLHLSEVKSTLEKKCLLITKELLKYPNVFEFIPPQGGYFVWVKSLKCDATKLLEIALKHKINFHIGNKFSPSKSCSNYFRLSFSYYGTEDISYFAERLQSVVNDVLTIYDNKIVVHLLGSNGRLGKLIKEKISASHNKVIGIEIDRSMNLSGIGKLTNEMNLSGIGKLTNEIIVDVSSEEGTTKLLNELLELNIRVPLIIGTTGNLPLELINKYKSKLCSVVVCSNFSVGVNRLLQTLLASQFNLDSNYWITSVLDIHHTQKKDSPSGTAKTIKQTLETIGFPHTEIMSRREGNVVGFHSITFESVHETITITHNAKDRGVFAEGCCRLIDKIIEEDKLKKD